MLDNGSVYLTATRMSLFRSQSDPASNHVTEDNDYVRIGIELEDSERIHVFELSRYLAAIARDQVLATASEQRVSVLPDMERLLVLDVLSTGAVSNYKPTASPNTHWK